MTYDIPQSAKEALDRYFQGIPTGDCLRAILSNDLFDAMKRADLEYRAKMFNICQYIYNTLPMHCYGSRETVDRWLRLKHDEMMGVKSIGERS